MNDLVSVQNSLPAEFREMFTNDVSSDLARLGGTGGGDAIRVTQNKTFKLADGTEIDGPMDVVVVDFIYRNQYYTGRYNPKEIQPPACFALHENAHEMTPSARSPSPQAATCAGCQQNEFGSDPNGDGKACKNGILLAVIPADGSSDDVSLVSVAPTAMKHFNKHVAAIARAGVPIYAAVTQLAFATDVTYASLRFSLVGPNQNFEKAKGLRETARARLLEEPDVSKYEAPKGKK